MKKIILLRHGETTITGKYIGATDIPLSPAGEKQLAEARSSLAGFDIRKIFCSPLKRCLQTCEVLSLIQTPKIDSRLAEINFGRWEGMSYEEIRVRYREETAEWAQQSDSFCFPGGEGVAGFRNRVRAFAEDISHADEETILIVTHGGVVRHLVCIFLNLPLQNYLYFKADYGRYACIDLYDKGGILTGLNW